MLEREVKGLLEGRKIPFLDQTLSHHLLDFFLPDHAIHIDVKEKLQAFSMQNWRTVATSQEHLFIIDDLAARKMLRHAPKSFCLIKDSSVTPPMYFVYSIVDLLCIPKKRVSRTIERTVKASKGKWLIDLRDAAAFDNLDDALTYILNYDKHFAAIFDEHLDCWGKYPSERIATSGTKRKSEFWKRDSKAHT